MAETIRGVIHGKTIELATDPCINDGQAVEVEVRIVRKAATWGEGILRSAGAMAEYWTEEDDRILEQLRKDRHHESRPEPSE